MSEKTDKSIGKLNPSGCEIDDKDAYIMKAVDKPDNKTCDVNVQNDDKSINATLVSKTFRKRRLTLTSNKHINDEDENKISQFEADIRAVAALDSGSDENENENDSVDQTQDEKRPRLCSNEEEKKNDSLDPPLQAKVQFSQQMALEVQTYCPILHGQSDFGPPHNGDIIVMTDCDSNLNNTVPDELLPFPRELVWTYSCHGIEPIFDEEFEEDEDIITSVAKINQDRGSVVSHYANCTKTALFSVYDGHGDGGELVSQYVATEVQNRLGTHPLFKDDISEAFRQTFVDVDRLLLHQAHIEPNYSGTTACVVLMRGKYLYTANVGDSRAVIAQKKFNNDDDGYTSENSDSSGGPSFFYESKDLSIDQNPDSPGEQERIEQCGGFVSPPPEPGLSARVWLDEGCTQIGLAMSRSIGDHSVKDVGVIAEPVVSKYEMQPEIDEFMIIASDGVWEFLDSNDAVQIVAEYIEAGDGAEKACQALIESAAAKWHEFEGDYRDDITVLVIHFNDLWCEHRSYSYKS